MSKLLAFFCAAVTVVLTCLFVVMLFTVNGNALTRYVFSFSLPWSEELTRYCMIWSVMLGAAVLALFDDHIALHIPNETWPRAVRKAQTWLRHGVVLFVLIVTTWTAFHFAIGMADVLATGLRLSMLWPTLAIPVGFSLITLAKLVVVYNEIASVTTLPSIPLPPQKAVMDNSFRPADDTPDEGHPSLKNGSDI